MLITIGDLIDDIVVHHAGDTSSWEHGTDNTAMVRHARGGSAANVAAAAAPLVATRFIGRVGADALGDALAHQLSDRGVDVRVQREGRTGTIVLLADGAEAPTMLTDRAAAADLGPIDPTWLDGATWVHITLYGLMSEPSCTAILDTVHSLPRPQVQVSIDLSSIAMMHDLGADRVQTLRAALRPDMVVANRDEARCAHDLGLHIPAAAYVVKNGAEPVLVTQDGVVSEIPVAPVPDAIDSIGAGDAFAAGYIAAALDGADPVAAARAGIQLAARSLTVLGAL